MARRSCESRFLCSFVTLVFISFSPRLACWLRLNLPLQLRQQI